MSAMQLNDHNFSTEVMKETGKPVLVDFWATWCGPCKLQSPIIEELAKEYEGKAKVGEMEVDENPNTPQQFGVLSIPTLMLFKDGKVAWQGVGLHQKEQLKKVINDHLA